MFPAYSKENNSARQHENLPSSSETEGTSRTWLSNSSFQAELPPLKTVIDISHDSSSNASIEDLSRRKSDFSEDSISSDDLLDPKDDENEKAHPTITVSKILFQKNDDSRTEELYYEDKYRDRGNSKVDTLCQRARPYYFRKKLFNFNFPKRLKKRKKPLKRYHTFNLDAREMNKKKNTTIRRDSVKDKSITEESVLSWCKNLEEEQTNRTRDFNEKLFKNPNDIQLWLEYITFQDDCAKFQIHHPLKDIQRLTNQRKLSIVEKGLEKNPNCTELLKKKLYLMADSSPADQLSSELETLVNKDSGNILLWESFIMVTQGSIAMCTIPKVLELYSKCFFILRQRAGISSSAYDQRLLRMLFQCLMFLRHAGLWEQMWETISLNLCLNLNLEKSNFHIHGLIDEKKLIAMEEMVLMSRLPLNQLWLRTESLRENCHWISVSKDQLELVGDSRRFVVPEDVADFVHPILSKDSNFRISIYSLLCLKVPLLPTRNYVLEDLDLKNLEWIMDSSEVLLPFAYPLVGEMTGTKERKTLLNGILDGRLTSGPQYLKFHPAQEPYLDFIRKTFHTIAENQTPFERTSLFVWWLRFERLLVFLNKDDPLQPPHCGKKLRNTVKEFLKKDNNRNNLHFYREYALIEKELGKFDNCLNILEKAIQLQNPCPYSISDYEEKTALFSLYRTYFQTLLNSEIDQDTQKERALSMAKKMVSGSNENQLLRVEKYLENCFLDFLREEPTLDERKRYFLPIFTCDMIVCYTNFLYIKDNDIYKIIQIFDKCISHSAEYAYLQEILYENKISILQLHWERTCHLHCDLENTVYEALSLYSANFYILSTFAMIQCEIPFWITQRKKINIDTWIALAMCLAGRTQIDQMKKVDPTGAAAYAAVNKLLSLHRTLARLPEIRDCPLIWRLYMLLLREEMLCEKKGEEVYHESVSKCPWARSVYIDAAEVAPQLLTQIQDVIREKELRMHVTPEELDILRG